MKYWLVLAALLGAGFGGYSVWSHWQRGGLAGTSPERPTTATVELRDIDFAVSAAGEISPAEQVSVRPEINGKIDVLPVDIGDAVEKGKLLFKLDDKELQQQRASNLTDIEKAKLELEKTQRDYQRAQRLLNDKLISQEVFDDTRTTFELGKNALERAQRDLAITEERLTKTEVRAPFDCTILTRPVSIGQAVSGSGGFNSGTEVLTIADLHSMIINAQVNQADVPRLKVGESVDVLIEAVPGLKVTGNVERISPQATIKNNIKGFAARVVLKDVDPRVRPGMTANVKIPVASAGNVTAVPLAAVFTEKNQDTSQMERFVYLQHGDSFEKRNVKVGVSDFFYAEIQEGVSPGDIVSLELPKEEREKTARQLAGQRPGVAGETPASRPAALLAATSTNSARTSSLTVASDPAPKAKPAAERTTRRDSGGSH
jgi:HlyD family secretion protein